MAPRHSTVQLAANTTRGSVLVVEDDADAREILRMLFEDEGYDVATADDGRDALERLRASPRTDVVVCDLMMPVMNGWDFCDAKALDPALAAIPVVVVSAVANMRGVREAPGDVVLAKPVELDRLMAAVASLCRRDDRCAG